MATKFFKSIIGNLKEDFQIDQKITRDMKMSRATLRRIERAVNGAEREQLSAEAKLELLDDVDVAIDHYDYIAEPNSFSHLLIPLWGRMVALVLISALSTLISLAIVIGMLALASNTLTAVIGEVYLPQVVGVSLLLILGIMLAIPLAIVFTKGLQYFCRKFAKNRIKQLQKYAYTFAGV